MTQTKKNYEIYKFLKMQVEQKFPLHIKTLREQEATLIKEAREVYKMLQKEITNT